MAGNSIGQLFKVTTFGESHGLALGCIIDGCPPNLEINENDLQVELNRRKPGQSRYTTSRNEDDQITILSGIFKGKTTGTPIGLMINNQDQRLQDYADLKDKFRPGHADYTYHHKYGIRDHHGGGRASARETTMRVAAGAIAKKYLRKYFNINIIAYLEQIGDIQVEHIDLNSINNNAFFCPDVNKIELFDQLIRDLLKQGDSIGAKIKVIATNVPVGLGEPVFDKLDADIAHALMSINAAKAIEIGDGMHVVSQKGSEHRDQISNSGFLSNHAGGILGGISTGQDITATVAFKPTSSIKIAGCTITSSGENTTVITNGRHDPCVGIRAVPIVEAMVAIVLMDHLLRNRAQNN